MTGPHLERRAFLRRASLGLGLASLSAGIVRAAVAPLPGPLPAAPLPETSIKPALLPLFARARAALDAHPDRTILRDRVGLADFSPKSSQHRFHLVDLASGATISYLVAHGLGSDPDHSGYLQTFSNEPGSQATSEGAYLTGEIYDGVHGMAMRLVGLDATNNNADMRAIVVHSAPYVSEDHVAQWGKVGRSNGCFVVAPHLISQVLALLGPGRLLFAGKQ